MLTFFNFLCKYLSLAVLWNIRAANAVDPALLSDRELNTPDKWMENMNAIRMKMKQDR